MQVSLLAATPDPESVAAAAINSCYSAKSGAELKESLPEKKRQKLINIVLAGGHLSTLEHVSFTFAITGLTRACTHQLVRHRIASFSQQSQRYVAFKAREFPYTIPPKIFADSQLKQKFQQEMQKLGQLYAEFLAAGIPAEDARAILPNATCSNLVVTMNARSLLNFLELRLCLRAQAEIRQVAQAMLKLVLPLAPNIFRAAGPTCEIQKICWEGKLSCGKWRSIPDAEVRSRVET